MIFMFKSLFCLFNPTPRTQDESVLEYSFKEGNKRFIIKMYTRLLTTYSSNKLNIKLKCSKVLIIPVM